jgi:50S ribosomal subunit-associated GTPase HflX
LPRTPHVRVYAKTDDASAANDPLRAHAELAVSAKTGEGLKALRELVREKLVPKADRDVRRPWVFDARLAR